MIEFFSSVKGVAESFPIQYAKDVQPQWTQKARENYKNKEDKTAPDITLCPGINEIHRSGYIVSAWCDFEVLAGDRLEARFPSGMEDVLGSKPINIQNGESIGKFLPKKPWANKDILKVNTPWHIKSNHKFLMIPIPYSEDFSLESTIGILDPSISNVINIQLNVNGQGLLEVKAGTPLCQLVPLTDKVEKMVVRDANKDDLEFLEKNKYISNNSFRLNRNLFRSLYQKFISKKCPFSRFH